MDTILNGRYQAILFDVGLTLVYPNPSRDAAILKILRERGFAISTADLDKGFQAAEAVYQATRWRQETTRDLRAFWFGYYAEFLAHLNPPTDDRALVAFLVQEVEKAITYHLYPDTLEVLAELRKRGFALGAVSNWNPKLPVLCQKWGLTPYFDVLIVSDVVGFYKPDPRIFELALTALQAPADRTLHVGDDCQADVEGARAAGITPLLLDRHGQYHTAHCLRACSLQDLRGLVGTPRRSN